MLIVGNFCCFFGAFFFANFWTIFLCNIDRLFGKILGTFGQFWQILGNYGLFGLSKYR